MKIGYTYAAPTRFGVKVRMNPDRWGFIQVSVVARDEKEFDVCYEYEADDNYTVEEREAAVKFVRDSILNGTLYLPLFIPLEDVKTEEWEGVGD